KVLLKGFDERARDNWASKSVLEFDIAIKAVRIDSFAVQLMDFEYRLPHKQCGGLFIARRDPEISIDLARRWKHRFPKPPPSAIFLLLTGSPDISPEIIEVIFLAGHIRLLFWISSQTSSVEILYNQNRDRVF